MDASVSVSRIAEETVKGKNLHESSEEKEVPSPGQPDKGLTIGEIGEALPHFKEIDYREEDFSPQLLFKEDEISGDGKGTTSQTENSEGLEILKRRGYSDEDGTES